MNVFKSEIGTEINVDAILSVSPMCDIYGACIRGNGRSFVVWYRVCVEDKERNVRGGYGDDKSGWITFGDFSRLKPLLVERGWSFFKSKSGSPWFVEGESGERPIGRNENYCGEALSGECFLPLGHSQMEVHNREEKDRAIQALCCGEFVSARRFLQRARMSHPEDMDVYKRLARVEVARGAWHEAVYSIVMWLELLVYEISLRSDKGRYVIHARQNVRKIENLMEIRIKTYSIPTCRILSMLENSFSSSGAALAAAVDMEPYIMLGYCYCMLFPRDVASYSFSAALLENYRSLQSGRPAGQDFRETSDVHVIFGIGLLMALANVKGDIKGQDRDELYLRWDRRPSYAVYTQTVDNAREFRDNWMRGILDIEVKDLSRRFGCKVNPRFSIHIEDMVADDPRYGKSLIVMLGATGQPLTTVPSQAVHTISEIENKLKDLRSVGDVYGMQFEVEVDDDDYIVSSTGHNLTDEDLAGWLSQNLKRNVYCGGTRHDDGVTWRIFSYFDIIQI